MTKRPVALDPEALRSFIEGVKLGSFTLAAERLSRSTSAVSAQLKKLEQQCGTALLRKNGRGLVLTESGEILFGYAQRLLAVNDEALQAVRGRLLEGEVRFGMQEDFGETLLPEILGMFSRAHSNVQITAQIGRNQELRHAIDRQQLDLALSWLDEETMPGIHPLAHLPLEWIGHPQLDIYACLEKGLPLPLVMFEAPCLMRSHAIAALDDAGIPWRIAFVSHSLSGVFTGVSAGLGITVRSRLGMPKELIANIHPNLPTLPSMGIALLKATETLTEAASCLEQLLVDALKGQLA